MMASDFVCAICGRNRAYKANWYDGELNAYQERSEASGKRVKQLLFVCRSCDALATEADKATQDVPSDGTESLQMVTTCKEVQS